MPAVTYGRLIRDALSGDIDISSPMRAAITDAGYMFSHDHVLLSDVLEPTGPGYPSGGVVIPHEVNYNTADGQVRILTASEIHFPTATLASISGIVFYLDQPSGGRRLVAWHNFWTPRPLNDAPFTYYPMNAEICRITPEGGPFA